MATPKNDVEPKFQHTFPSEKPYFDTSSSTEKELRVTTKGKYGSDYGVKNDPHTKTQPVQAVTNGGSEAPAV